MIDFGELARSLRHSAPPSLAARREADELATPPRRAIVQPQLCADMPHRWQPATKTRALCLRCGAWS